MKKSDLKFWKHELGAEINIPKDTRCAIFKPYTREYYGDTIEVIIGIGKDHTASLVMDVEDWDALKSGEPVHISTAANTR